MAKIARILFFFALTLCFPIIVPAQNLHPLKDDPAIVSGSLANGVRYYLVANPSYKGMADIALVQKAGKEDEKYDDRGETSVLSRAAFAELPHFSKVSPFGFMAGKGLWPGEEGYTTVGDQATVYRFDNLVLSRQGAIVDSTLLMVFDIIGRDYGRMKKEYSTDNQAIIISGDINQADMLGKMGMLSLFVTGHREGEKQLEYEWHDLMSTSVVISDSAPGVSVSYRFPRTPASRMATAVPLVSQRYVRELQIVLGRRLSHALKVSGIPYSSIDFSYEPSSSQPGDEVFTVRIGTSVKYMEPSLRVLSSVLAGLDGSGLAADEYEDISKALEAEVYERYGSPYTQNRAYMDRCISSFLYGFSLASNATSLDFFIGRKMDSEVAVNIYNRFIFALLDRSRNLTIGWNGPGTQEEVVKIFRDSWIPWQGSFPTFRGDTLSLRKGYSKSKIKSSIPETMFGGNVWTFSNGIKVIYKQLPQRGFFRWAWVLGGGYSSLPGISDGEGAFVSDLFRLRTVAGMSPERFRGMLSSNGITLDADVEFSEFTLSGSAPESRFELLLKALSAMTSSGEVARGAYDYYRACNRLAPSPFPVESVLDSLMHQTMTYSPYRRPIALKDDLPSRADRLFSSLFSKMNDGVLIIVGGMSPERVSRTLSLYMGGFRTEKASTFRSRRRHGLREGRNVFRTRASEPMLAISLSAPFNYTAENFMAANIAAYTLSERVASAVAWSGWRVRSDWTLKMFPDESLDMMFYLGRVPVSGLPASMAREDSTDVIAGKVRAAIDAAGQGGITGKELAVGKSVVANYYASWSSDPASIMRMLVLRYSYGKDLVSGYVSKIEGVTAASVDPILRDLAAGGSGEYVAVRASAPAVVEPALSDKAYPYIPPVTYVKGAYSFDGSVLPPEPLPLESLRDMPTIDFGEDSAHAAWRDSVVISRAMRLLDSTLDYEQ